MLLRISPLSAPSGGHPTVSNRCDWFPVVFDIVLFFCLIHMALMLESGGKISFAYVLELLSHCLPYPQPQ